MKIEIGDLVEYTLDKNFHFIGYVYRIQRQNEYDESCSVWWFNTTERQRKLLDNCYTQYLTKIG